jgi:hypothetical protein
MRRTSRSGDVVHGVGQGCIVTARTVVYTARDLYLDAAIGLDQANGEARNERLRIIDDGGTVIRQVVTPTPSGWTVHTEYNAPRKEHP